MVLGDMGLRVLVVVMVKWLKLVLVRFSIRLGLV